MVSFALGRKKGEYASLISSKSLYACVARNRQVALFITTHRGISDSHAGKTAGPVTALALSFDHTYVVSGHSSGFIQLYDLKTPNSPVRTVPPTTVLAISTGRKEGHIQGSRIVNVGFVAGRHTAIVSADEHGLAFYHSLGKMLFIEASDILRILGKYPLDSLPSSDGSPSDTSTTRRRKSRYSILAMMPLPLGTTSHPTDAYNVVALLTSTKLVIVGLKPTPKTWFKCPREIEQDPDLPRTKLSLKGSLSWFPSVLPNSSGKVEVVENNPLYHFSSPTNPRLVYSWGRTLYILQVFESKVKQTFRNSRSGKASEVEVGTIGFENLGKWSANDDILAVQWLNVNVGSFTSAAKYIPVSKLISSIASARLYGGFSRSVRHSRFKAG